MDIIVILMLAVALSMDAFAVSVCKGLAVSKLKKRHALSVGLYFGIFQGLMPFIGYMLGNSFSSFLTGIDHWIAFGLLSIIGFNMVKESFEDPEDVKPDFSPKTMLAMAVATSIDALAVGITFALREFTLKDTIISVSIIAIITFALSILGIIIGNIFGAKYKSKAEMAGGLVLIAIGIKILFQDLGILF